MDPDHLDTLATVQSLAVLYRHKGQLAKPVDLYQWALYDQNRNGRGIEGEQGPTHSNTIHTVLGYAIVMQHQGNYKEAYLLCQAVLHQRKAKLGEEHLDTLKP
ncbi:hypothetical protein N7492_002981 [Penicillium capsulatum]|uniref:Kinesin light chain n=1 Tax=Penicillium capsulatum TaxID=69766 RepID=A0A9W9LVN9_9EURO|nr:hypothetical protein N7492_002981 [Penicillium capsulatum]